ncbi:conserved protein of unknown function [Magnetospirillum sp. XM-1]|uniref:hypothetical protein n=1 Tax=Magnetospirillum sp. XM-1 TaxID=1663591 RepID=UPI00073DCA98|nr:hypothetical protein [Magnetospirillum sp. XM-1]CUW41621.1 conserved protein of unknown function [Magnetospirillum sp. XM-1]
MRRIRTLVATGLMLVISAMGAAAQTPPPDAMPLKAVLEKLNEQRFDVRGISYQAPWWVVVLRTPRGGAMTAGFDAVTGEMRDDFPVERLPAPIPGDVKTALEVVQKLSGPEENRITAVRYLNGDYHVDLANGGSARTIILDARTGLPRP